MVSASATISRMLWIRKGFGLLLSTLLLVVLLGIVGATTLTTYLSKPDHIESWLQSSNLYGHFVDGVIQQSKQSTGGQDSSTVSLSDTAVQEAAHSAFSTDVIQKDVNTFLDANYDWISGKTAAPEFTIDLTAQKQQFANQVGQYVTSYLKNLPVCTAAQQAQITNPNQDPLSLTCRPSIIDPQAEGTQITGQLATSGDFLSSPKITQDSITAQGQGGVSYYSKLSFLPKVYRLAIKLPLILTAFAALLSLGVFLIAPRKRAGVRRIGVVFLVAGIVLLFEKLVADSLVKHVNLDKLHLFNSGTQQTSGPLQQSLTTFVQHAESALTKFDLYFGLGFVVFGLAVIIALIIKGRRGGSSKSAGTIDNPLPVGTPKATKAQKQAAVPPVQPAKLTPAESVTTALKAIKVPTLPTLKSPRQMFDIVGPKPVAQKPKPAQPKKPAVSPGKSVKLKPRKPPRLIQ